MRFSAPRAIGATLDELLTSWGGSPARSKLNTLWRDWPAIMGAELAELAKPAGASKRLLLLACDSAARMQEASFLVEEYQRRANEFLESEYFEGCRAVLGRPKKAVERKTARNEKKRTGRLDRPSGKYLATMDANSPVARCYALFVGKKTKRRPTRKED